MTYFFLILLHINKHECNHPRFRFSFTVQDSLSDDDNDEDEDVIWEIVGELSKLN